MFVYVNGHLFKFSFFKRYKFLIYKIYPHALKLIENEQRKL